MTKNFEYAIHGPKNADWMTLSHPIGSSLDIWAGRTSWIWKTPQISTWPSSISRLAA